jgi:hypothetical protein
VTGIIVVRRLGGRCGTPSGSVGVEGGVEGGGGGTDPGTFGSLIVPVSQMPTGGRRTPPSQPGRILHCERHLS